MWLRWAVWLGAPQAAVELSARAPAISGSRWGWVGMQAGRWSRAGFRSLPPVGPKPSVFCWLLARLLPLSVPCNEDLPIARLIIWQFDHEKGVEKSQRENANNQKSQSSVPSVRVTCNLRSDIRHLCPVSCYKQVPGPRPTRGEGPPKGVNSRRGGTLGIILEPVYHSTRVPLFSSNLACFLAFFFVFHVGDILNISGPLFGKRPSV